MDHLLSVIIPSFNEELALPQTASVISDILNSAGIQYEILFVDDGSVDGTWEIIKGLHQQNPNVKGVSFSRNFGKEAAMYAGLSYATGDAFVIIDCDLQHPPEKIVEMYQKWNEGYLIVEGVKSTRGSEGFLYSLCAGLFYSIINKIININVKGLSDFKLIDKKVRDAILSIGGKKPFFRYLTIWTGFKSEKILFDVHSRIAGKSKWSGKSLIKYAISSITDFSTAPIQLLGVLVAVLMILVGGLAVAGIFVPTAAKMILGAVSKGILVLAGIVASFFLCVVGYYFSKIIRRNMDLPEYIVKDTSGELSDK